MKKSTSRLRNRVTIWIAILVTGATIGSNPVLAQGDPITVATWNAYSDAIADAAVSRPGEVATDLLSPTGTDSRTQWQIIDGIPHLLAQRISWRAISTVKPGEPFTLLSHLFIAISGEVDKECVALACNKLKEKALNLRMAQLLGLPPDADNSVLSRFWVNPSDIIRPCTNVDIMNASCPQLMANTLSNGVDWSSFLFEQGMDSWRTQRKGTPQRISCDSDYADKYKGNCFGYPWTRLGYTFDWSPKAKDDRGVTEFVVAQGSTVYLESAGSIRSFYPYSK